ncbi:DEAD/DEAH box helicase [Mycolicibacterium conceptionense]|uniref:DEAD/DEAH box helicase n=1 Tax=Mycolicibacterium conceptionense TaxID=451644 RepID=A0A0U1DPH2_9MYCO|nr:DEAD/DEAH box helicase [Mycolicibacterium conceptionense]
MTTDEERARIAEIVDRRCADLAESDLIVLDYHQWREGLLRGLAAHHAGMLPVFRHTVEELFTAGLVKAVFATETLALGINMPARTVVLERLVKFNGEQHVPLTPGEYTQLTGRAGRRGIDVEGHAVVLWRPDDSNAEPAEVAGLASTRTFPLRSSFAPSYNMTINLVQQMGPEQAHRLLERSFAQYQADRSVVGLVRGIARGERMMGELAVEFGGKDAPPCATAGRWTLEYYSASRDSLSHRTVDPIRVALVGDNSYLEAWCRTAEAVRLFRFDRIVDAQVLDEASAPPPPAVQAGPDTSLFDADPALPSATLLVDATAAWVFDYYPLRVVNELPGGACEAAMTYASDEWMARFVLGFGSAVRVLAPESLAQRVRDAAAEALRVYDADDARG